MSHYHARIHSYGSSYATPGHRPECDCGWADPTTYPLGWYDAALAALKRHQEAHHAMLQVAGIVHEYEKRRRIGPPEDKKEGRLL